jgi:hypothetical protein
MYTNRRRQAIHFALAILFLAGCGQTGPAMSVSEVWQMSSELDGQTLRVRGPASLRFSPFHPLLVGGCSLVPAENALITGRVALLEDPHDPNGRVIWISETSFHCSGDTCSVSCQPFLPPEDLWGQSRKVENTYEFVGRLRVEMQEEAVRLILEEVDVTVSRQQVEGKWEPLQVGTFSIHFP